MADLCYVYFLFKITYIAESTVAELGKKSLLKSNFFVYHHTVIATMAWLGANYFPGGNLAFLVVLNSLVHVTVSSSFVMIMLFPDRMQKYLKPLKSFFEFLMVRKFKQLKLQTLITFKLLSACTVSSRCRSPHSTFVLERMPGPCVPCLRFLLTWTLDFRLSIDVYKRHEAADSLRLSLTD
jgi:GNS1/SUR4 family